MIFSSPSNSVRQADLPAMRVGLKHRVPSLDGMRAISIALVFINHAMNPWAHELARPFRERASALLAGCGGLGVKVFFVISGFLITTLLLEERAATGTINIRAFYLRRAFRIFPAYYVVVLMVGILAAAGYLSATRADFLHVSTFTWIYNFHQWNWYFAHTWSLSVEEQFYLLWPIGLLVLGPVRGVWAAIAIIFLMPFARAGLILTPRGNLNRLCYVLATGQFDTLMFGCLAALWWSASLFEEVVAHLITWYIPTIAASVAVLTVAASCLEPEFFKQIPMRMCEDTLVAAGITFSLVYVIERPTSAVGRLLNMPTMAYIGVLSYSLYLWQQVFLTPAPAMAIQKLPLNFFCAVTAALSSYYLVERPMLRLRGRVIGKL